MHASRVATISRSIRTHRQVPSSPGRAEMYAAPAAHVFITSCSCARRGCSDVFGASQAREHCAVDAVQPPHSRAHHARGANAPPPQRERRARSVPPRVQCGAQQSALSVREAPAQSLLQMGPRSRPQPQAPQRQTAAARARAPPRQAADPALGGGRCDMPCIKARRTRAARTLQRVAATAAQSSRSRASRSHAERIRREQRVER
mmetsp:Transcript_22829/g.52607  ORF Transcript_22829/g.52607 Transcript_22829/m.52607 type:complete len:204 (+) Transcript_22829:839-1450(+)